MQIKNVKFRLLVHISPFFSSSKRKERLRKGETTLMVKFKF